MLAAERRWGMASPLGYGKVRAQRRQQKEPSPGETGGPDQHAGFLHRLLFLSATMRLGR